MMNSIGFDFEWITPEHAQGLELRATWAKLEISFKGDSITFIDHSSRSVRRSLFLPLYPLAEWIATHWWFLFYEVETRGRSTSDSYAERHNIRFGSEGYAVPPLLIQPMGESVKLEWRPTCLLAQNLEFTGTGVLYVPAAEIKDKLSAFISAIIKRLHDQGIEGSLLEEEWDSIQLVDPDETAFCAAAAALGIDPYSLDEDQQRQILRAAENIPSSLQRDFFAVADLSSLGQQADQLLGALESSRSNNVDLESIKSLRNELAETRLFQGSPWNQGYRFADELRQRLNLNGELLNSLPSLGRALNVPPQDLRDAIIKIARFPNSMDALVATNSFQSPAFAVPTRRAEAIRFTFCRALFEYLTTPESQPLLVTRALSDRQKRNRAFAAEFLVPAHLLQEALPGNTVGDEELDDLAAKFGVSSHVIRHQVENHELASILD